MCNPTNTVKRKSSAPLRMHQTTHKQVENGPTLKVEADTKHRSVPFTEKSVPVKSDEEKKQHSPRISRLRIVEPSGSRIRSRYLNRIGLTNTRPSTNLHKEQKMSPITIIEPLKHDYGQVDEDLKSQAKTSSSDSLINSSCHRSSFSSMSSIGSSTSSISSTISPKSSSKKGVSFDATVMVKHIPMRSEYSDRIKHQLWPDSEEMQRSACRNALEFASEHWDWRLAAEDRDFFINLETGEKIHPVHYVRYLRARQHASQKDSFLDISRRAAKQWTHM